MGNNATIQKIFDMPLYEKIALNEEIYGRLNDYLLNQKFNDLSIDLYCPECSSKSTFNAVAENQIASDRNAVFSFFKQVTPFCILHYRCARDRTHYLCMQLMLIDENTILKIGQFPSKSDIEAPELDRFSKVIPKEKLSDLKRSVGLASHGIGAGSLVYLRRVFEFLLSEAHSKALVGGSFDQEAYSRSRVIEQIKMLRGFLPAFMVDNAIAYGIMSKGVHELTEQECLSAYGLMSDTIELILDEMLALKLRDEKLKKISAEIGVLHSKLVPGSN